MSVVHCKRASYDVYVGRGRCPVTDEAGRWGNPYRIGEDGDREQVVALYREYLWAKIQTGCIPIADLAALDGKVLGCWCAPRPCHGDVLLRAAAWAVAQLEAEPPSSPCLVGPMSRLDIEERADPKDRMMLAASAPYVAFRYALERGWITEDQHETARAKAGSRWNYCGD